MSILIVDQYLLVFQVVYCLIVDVVDGVGVVQRIRRRLFPGKKEVIFLKKNCLIFVSVYKFDGLWL